MAKVAEIKEVEVAVLKPYENNAKIHGKDQVEKICNSIKEFGFLSPCLIDRDLNIIAGHGRVLAAQKLGLKTVPCLFIEGLTDEQRKAYILADNKLTELGEWDAELVAAELKALDDAGFDITITGFEVDDEILDTGDLDDMGIGDQIAAMTADKEPVAKRGDVWILGNHRVMCGDSTMIDDVQKLCGGETMDLLVTDPPYNVDYSAKNEYLNSTDMNNRIETPILNDKMSDENFYAFLRDAFLNAFTVLREGGAFYIWHADMFRVSFAAAVKDAGLELKQILIWVKTNFAIGLNDYQWKHEPCLYGWKPGAAHYFQSARNISTVIRDKDFEKLDKAELIRILKEASEPSTVIECSKPLVSALHPTMKPVELFERHIKNSSEPGQNVIDLFGGSGTTLMACEKLGRRCFMMELDPAYVDVIVKRWEDETGKKAVLMN